MSIRIAVLLSGSGTTLENIVECCVSGAIDGEVVCVMGSRGNAYGLVRAENAGIPNRAVVRKEYSGIDDFSKAVWEFVGEYEPDLVVLAGFMSLLHFPEAYAGRIMNVHPALIPAFCGKGMYGQHVYRAVLEYGVKLTGVTVHFVDEEYDNGPIILQSMVEVLEGDSQESLAERVQAEERAVYPRAIQWFAEDRLRIEGRVVHVLPE